MKTKQYRCLIQKSETQWCATCLDFYVSTCSDTSETAINQLKDLINMCKENPDLYIKTGKIALSLSTRFKVAMNYYRTKVLPHNSQRSFLI